jgi:hypothetical protein
MRRTKPKNLKGHMKPPPKGYVAPVIKGGICSICEQVYVGFGNNARPINSGRCCDDCNALEVIPARIMAMMYARGEVDEDPDPDQKP